MFERADVPLAVSGEWHRCRSHGRRAAPSCDIIEHVLGRLAVVGLASREFQLDRQAVPVYGAWILVVFRAAHAIAEPFLPPLAAWVDPDGGRVDHLDATIIGLRDRARVAPSTGPPAHDGCSRSSRGRSGISAHGEPDRKRQKMPFSTRRSSTRATPRDLRGNNGSMILHSASVRSYRSPSQAPLFESLSL